MLYLVVCALLAAPALASRLPYIVNGKDAMVGAWPWQASLQQGGSHFCGGAVISDQWVLTAAHCVVLGPQGPFQVVLGLHDQQKQLGQPETYQTGKIIAHADFDMYANFILNDIALIKLDRPINFNNSLVSTVVMAEADGQNFVGSVCFLTGWGRMGGNEQDIAQVLQQVTTSGISRADCEDMWKFGWGWKIADSHLCLWNGQGGACQGDSGGPAVCEQNGDWILAGITSGGSPICNVRRPSIYTRVSAFRAWITEHSGLE